MEILSHINKRVKHRPEIPLPMLDLWNIYTQSTSSTIVRNFCIVYIEMAFERLPTEVFSFPLLITNFLRSCFNISAKVNRISLPSCNRRKETLRLTSWPIYQMFQLSIKGSSWDLWQRFVMSLLEWSHFNKLWSTACICLFAWVFVHSIALAPFFPF